MTKKENSKKIAFILLRTHTQAEIYLDNKDYHGSEQVLRGFEWTIHTIENNREVRLYIADSYKQAKQWCVKKGYDFIDDDLSKKLYEVLITKNK